MKLQSGLMVLCFVAGGLLAQQKSPTPETSKPVGATAKSPADVPGDTVVAVLNGRKFTADEIRKMVAATPPQAQAVYNRDPKEFLRAHAVLMQLVAYAEKKQLEKDSPVRETLDFYRMYVLSNAAVNHRRLEIEVSPEEQKAWYEKNGSAFREAKVRMVYVPFTDTQSELEAKARAEAVAKRARAGEDFVKLAKESSEDSAGAGGEFAVRKDSAQPPEQMKAVLLAGKAGMITDPMRHDNGYYVFRVESMDSLPFQKVRDEIYKEILNNKFAEWQKGLQTQVSVQFENEAFLQSTPEAK